MRVGVLGLGAMGRAMAANLVAAGHEVRAWNRSGGQVEGAVMVATPAQALDADAALTMLADDAAIRQTLLESGALQSAREGLVHAVASTISVAFAHELTKAHRSAGVAYVSAPVLGRPDVAAKGELQILAAGVPQAVERVLPVLEAIGQRIWDLGEDPPRANAAKVACNMMIAMAIETMAEAVAITEANGLGRDRFFELILGTLFGSRANQVYAANIAASNYEPGFRAVLGLKDLRLAHEAAAAAGANLPMLEAVRRRMQEAVEAGLGERDWSVIADFTLGGGARR